MSRSCRMSTNEDFIDETIANLKILGMLGRNSKLCVRKGNLCIDAPHVQSLRRWIHGDSRDTTLVHVKTSINNGMKIARALMACSPTPTTIWTMRRISDEMEACEVGLQNLKATYAGDSMVIANIDVLAERQIAHRHEIEAWLHNNGVMNADEILKTAASCTMNDPPTLGAEAKKKESKS